METKHIEEFLQKFSDQRLANLQCAAEDGSLVYVNPCGCLLYHHQGSYGQTKWHHKTSALAQRAEEEFKSLGGADPFARSKDWPENDVRRRSGLLPLIHAEWARRAQPVPVTFETPAKVEVFIATARQS